MLQSLQNGTEFLLRGGWIIFPLLFLALLSVTVMLERALTIREAASDNEKLFDQLEPLLQARRFAEAVKVCEATSGLVASVMASGIRNQHLDFPDIERAMEELALRETPVLHQRLGVLDTVITMAPLMGLLGTITGMIQAFNVVSGPDAASKTSALTGGVGEALIATAMGLTIAISTLPIYNYLTERVGEITAEMEVRATQLLNILAVLRHEDDQKELLRWQSRPLVLPEMDRHLLN